MKPSLYDAIQGLFFPRAQQLIYFSDPWGRDLNHLNEWSGVISWSYADFQMGWNYSEYGVTHPYFGAVIMPWSIDVSVKGKVTSGSVITVTASITYPCPTPFDTHQYPAKDATAQIVLSHGMEIVGGASIVSLGIVQAGCSATITWRVRCLTDCIGETVLVSASGIVSGWVPEAHWNGQTVCYPAYKYADAIGGEMITILS